MAHRDRRTGILTAGGRGVSLLSIDMKPQRLFVGREASPVVIVDGVSGDPRAVVELAAALVPFEPARGSYYPGLRRLFGQEDRDAIAYMERTLEAAAPFIGGGFNVDRFDLIEASFSMVTLPPAALVPAQRAPHFDSADPDYLAVLHYLAPTAGTAFYRQRSTNIETVSSDNQARFIDHARRESASLSGYIGGSNAAFEQIGMVEGLVDRLVIYPGRLLHSSVIPSDESLSPDPRRGRLTANFFIQARR